MKTRLKLLISLLLLGFAKSLFGLGLGDISADSALNEPLVARIELLNVGGLTEQELLVEIGSVDDYNIAGVERDYFHTSFMLEPVVSETGDAYISVTTSAPVREPYLNFVIQIQWPQGRLLREYTLLLDLPLFTGRNESQPVAQAETAPVAETRTVAPTIAAVAEVQTPVAKPSISGAQYRVLNGDTLWSLAGRVAEGTEVTRHQAMMAIRDLNPNAFINGDPNSLQAGVLIRVPGQVESQQRSNQQAVIEFNSLQQNQGQAVQAQPIAATPVSASANNFREQSAAPTTNSGRLALGSSAALGSGAATEEDTQAGTESINALNSENQTLKEELDRASLENQDLRERIEALEQQLAVSEAIAELENDEMANIQAAATAIVEEEPEEQLEQLSQESESLEEQVQQVAEIEEVQEPPVPAPVVTPEPIEEPAPSLISKLIGFAPYIGAVVVIALLVVMLLMRRRKSEEEHDFFDAELDDEDEEYEDPADTVSEDAIDTDATASFDVDELEDDDGGFESMDELFGAPADDDADEELSASESEEEETVEEDSAEDIADLDDVEDADVEDIDLEAALEDLDEFADLDSFLDEDIEDVDLGAEDGLGEVEEQPEEAEESFDLDVAEPATSESDEDEFNIDLPEEERADDSDEIELGDDNSMDFDESLELPEIEEEEDQEPAGNEMEFDADDLELPEELEESDDAELDGGNSMDFDDSLELPEVEEEEDQEPAGNEMEFDTGDLELPEEIEESDDTELDDGNSMDFDDSLELPEIEEEEDQEPAGNEMEFDVGDLDLPEAESEPEEQESEDDFGLDLDELELPGEAEEEDSDDLLDSLSDDLSDEFSDEAGGLEDDLESDMDELLEGLDDEMADVSSEDELSTEDDSDFDLGDGLDLDDDLLADFGDEQVDDDGDLSEEMSTKLELADAYVEMGDIRGARELIEEIMADGDDGQKEAASKLAERIEGLG